MSTFTQFDEQAAGRLREELNSVLAKFGQETNLEFSVGAIKYMDTSLELKLECKVVGGQSKTELALAQAISMYQLSNEDRMGKFRMVGYNSKKWSKPFILEEIATKKRFVANLEQIQLRFAKA